MREGTGCESHSEFQSEPQSSSPSLVLNSVISHGGHGYFRAPLPPLELISHLSGLLGSQSHPLPHCSPCQRAHSHKVLLKIFYDSLVQAPSLPCTICKLVNFLKGPLIAQLRDVGTDIQGAAASTLGNANRCPLFRRRDRGQVESWKQANKHILNTCCC